MHRLFHLKYMDRFLYLKEEREVEIKEDLITTNFDISIPFSIQHKRFEVMQSCGWPNILQEQYLNRFEILSSYSQNLHNYKFGFTSNQLVKTMISRQGLRFRCRIHVWRLQNSRI
jgi:hypothetical protein